MQIFRQVAVGAITAVTLLQSDGRAAEPARPVAPDANILGWVVGRWAGTRTEPSSGERAPLRTEVASVLGGVGEEERIEVGEGAHVYRGLYVQVFDPGLKKSVMMYVNSTRREFARLEGVAGPDRAQWESTTARGAHRSRLRYERSGRDSWRRTQFVSEDEGRHWNVLFVDEMHRP